MNSLSARINQILQRFLLQHVTKSTEKKIVDRSGFTDTDPGVRFCKFTLTQISTGRSREFFTRHAWYFFFSLICLFLLG